MLKLKKLLSVRTAAFFCYAGVMQEDVTHEEALSCHFDGDALPSLVRSLKDRVELTERRR